MSRKSKAKKTASSSVAAPLTPPSIPSLWLLLAALVALGVIAYWNSFDVPLVFDDQFTIQRNAGVRFGDLNWNLLAGRSLLFLTFALNYVWTGQEVWSYHVVNLALHLIDGLLVFFVASHLFQRGQIAERQSR